MLQFDFLALAGMTLQSLLLRDVILRLPTLPLGKGLRLGGFVALPMAAYLLFRVWGVVVARRTKRNLPFEVVGMMSGCLLSLAVLFGFGREGLFWLAAMAGLLAWNMTSGPERYDDRKEPRERYQRLGFLRAVGSGFFLAALGLGGLGLLDLRQAWAGFVVAAVVLVGPVWGAIRGTPRY